MYAVIETGGKQYRVEVGTELEVELLEVEPGQTITLDRVLLVADGDEAAIGRPLVTDAAVTAEILRFDRGPKLISFKYRPKARSRVKKGHRQELTVLRISDITFGGKSAAKVAAKAASDAKTERMRVEEAAAVQAAKDAELAAKLAVGTAAKTAADAKAATKTAAKTTPAAKTPAAKTATKAATTDTKTKTTAAPKPAAKAAAPKATAKTDPEPKAAAPKKARTTKKDE